MLTLAGAIETCLDLFSPNCLKLAGADSDLHAPVHAWPTACCLDSKVDGNPLGSKR
jgi:hypothetical protein